MPRGFNAAEAAKEPRAPRPRAAPPLENGTGVDAPGVHDGGHDQHASENARDAQDAQTPQAPQSVPAPVMLSCRHEDQGHDRALAHLDRQRAQVVLELECKGAVESIGAKPN